LPRAFSGHAAIFASASVVAMKSGIFITAELIVVVDGKIRQPLPLDQVASCNHQKQHESPVHCPPVAQRGGPDPIGSPGLQFLDKFRPDTAVMPPTTVTNR
jgi:hypothetical protein